MTARCPFPHCGGSMLSSPAVLAQPAYLTCTSCGRGEATYREAPEVTPGPAPLTGLCPRGHDREKHGYYRETRRGPQRACRECDKTIWKHAAANIRGRGRRPS